MEGSAASAAGSAAGSAASTQQGKVQALLDAGDDPFTLLVPAAFPAVIATLSAAA